MKMKEVSLDRQRKRMTHTTSCHKNYKAEQDVPRMLPKEESNLLLMSVTTMMLRMARKP